MSYFYRGRHRRPTHTGRNAAAVLASGAFAVPVSTAFAPTANADILDAIEQCESGGNPSAQNSSSTASGAFQFLDSTWQRLGGSGSAADHSYATQRAMAEKLLAAEGTSPWNASRSCWEGKGGAVVQHTAPKLAPHAAAPRKSWAGSAAALGRRAADGTGVYRCTPAMLSFDACDPDTLGQVVAFPPYDGHTAKVAAKVAVKPVAKPAVKAPARRSWAGAPADLHNRDHYGNGVYVCDTAHLGYARCDPDNIGQTVAYPRFDKYR